MYLARYLAEEEHQPEYLEFVEQQKLQMWIHKLKGNKEPFDFIPKSVIAQALVTVLGANPLSLLFSTERKLVFNPPFILRHLDKRNHPILIHCNKGKVCVSL